MYFGVVTMHKSYKRAIALMYIYFENIHFSYFAFLVNFLQIYSRVVRQGNAYGILKIKGWLRNCGEMQKDGMLAKMHDATLS